MKEQLNETLVIGWCDVSAAGCRAILGCDTGNHKFDLEIKNLDISRLQEQITCNKTAVPILSKIDCCKEKVSLISISSQLSSGACTQLINAILDKVNESKTKEIVVIAAVHLKIKSTQDSEVFQVHINCNKEDSIPALPENVLIKDSMFNTLIQFMQAEKTPLKCYLTQGYKITSGQPNALDGSEQSIKNLQRVLNDLYGIQFDQAKTNLFDYQAKDSKSANSMYL